MITLLSKLKFGQALGLLEIKLMDIFQKLYYKGSKANLKEIFESFDEKKENIIRAEYISSEVKELVKRG